MSEQTRERPLGPMEKRRRTVVWSVFGVSAAAGFVLGGMTALGTLEPFSWIRTNPWIVPVMLAVTVAAALGGCVWYWRAIDELARQAHLEAWFWGGSTAMTLAVLWLAFAPQLPAAWSFGLMELPAGDALFYGGMTTFGAGLVGYGLVWVAYWLRRR